MPGQAQHANDQALIDVGTDESISIPKWEQLIHILSVEKELDLKKPLPHEYILEADQRICVAGTRKFDDVELFEMLMDDETDLYKTKGSFIFVSGDARTGADRLVIDWCIKRGYPYVTFPADWDTHGKSAGYVRNADMGKVITRLTVFWDGMSKGTKHMIEVAEERSIKPRKYVVDINKD